MNQSKKNKMFLIGAGLIGYAALDITFQVGAISNLKNACPAALVMWFILNPFLVTFGTGNKINLFEAKNSMLSMAQSNPTITNMTTIYWLWPVAMIMLGAVLIAVSTRRH